MPARPVHRCLCALCQQEETAATRAHHEQINLVLSRLDEQQRRWSAALEAHRLGPGGGQRVAEITGLSVKTIQRGQQELASSLVTRPTTRVRLGGGGRPRAEKKTLL